MKQGPPWEANMFQATLEISRILWYAKIHHRIYKRPTICPYLEPDRSSPKDRSESEASLNIS